MSTFRRLSFLAALVLIAGAACSTRSGLPGSQSGGGASSGSGAKPLLAFGSEGIGAGMFTDGRGLAVNPSTGAMFVADYRGGRVQAFDPTGKAISQWMIQGATKDSLITGMTGDAKGDVFILDTAKILVYDSSGKLKTTFAIKNSHPFTVAVEANGNLLVSTLEEAIYQLSPAGKVLNTINSVFTGNGGDAETEVRVAVDAGGDIYALGGNNNAVFKFSPQGKFVNRFGSEGDTPGKFSAPTCIAVDSKGRFYVGDIKGVQVFDADGTYKTLLASAIGTDGVPRNLAFDSQDNLYMTTSKDKVFKYAALP